MRTFGGIQELTQNSTRTSSPIVGEGWKGGDGADARGGEANRIRMFPGAATAP